MRVQNLGQDPPDVLSAAADADLVLIVVAEGDDEIFLGRMVQETSELEKPVLICPYTVLTSKGASGGLEYSAATIESDRFRTVCFTDWLGKGFEEGDLVYQQLFRRLEEEVVQFVLPAEQQGIFKKVRRQADAEEDWGPAVGFAAEFTNQPSRSTFNSTDDDGGGGGHPADEQHTFFPDPVLYRSSVVEAELQGFRPSGTSGTVRAAATTRSKVQAKGKKAKKMKKTGRVAAGRNRTSPPQPPLSLSIGSRKGDPDAPQWSMLAGGPPTNFAAAGSAKFDKQRRGMAMRPQKWTKAHKLAPLTAGSQQHADGPAAQQQMNVTNSSPSPARGRADSMVGVSGKTKKKVKKMMIGGQQNNSPPKQLEPLPRTAKQQQQLSQGSLKARMSHLKKSKA